MSTDRRQTCDMCGGFDPDGIYERVLVDGANLRLCMRCCIAEGVLS